MGEKLVGGPAVYGWGAELFFLPSLMGKNFFLQGPRPPQATMWLRPWPRGSGTVPLSFFIFYFFLYYYYFINNCSTLLLLLLLLLLL